MRALVLILALWGTPGLAETVIAARTIRAHSVLGPDDLALAKAEIPGALEDMALAIGQEARVMIYAGRPVRAGDLGPPALIERNQIVILRFVAGALTITTEGRAMERGAVGDRIRAVNVASRLPVSGRVTADGTLHVDGSTP
ncbi:MAG: flagellar basal body P-ring formation chaperone FlgA [Pseudomonadota bacterium]